MPGYALITHEHVDSVKNPIQLMELLVDMHKNAVRANDAQKRYLDLVSSISYWLLKECKSQEISIPKGYYLSQLIKKEGLGSNIQNQPISYMEKNPPLMLQNVVIC